ncbi:hypothetical protein HHK36_026647 [Tetracentron sinense]|uniref:BSD domain-containing protein n=1 Tax=Tetracentron sinense TaxID=13715 RepID=A0A834YLR2_TETSI|nr:hypothetical protein HHK36_026647 [Tetracentron sinense]
MDFFKSVFSDDPEPSNIEKTDRSASASPKESYEEEDPDREASFDENDSNPSSNPNPSGGSAWSFGGLIKTFASKSESVIQTYRRDLEEFGSGLKKETAAIREAASRAVKELPVSIEVGASVAQESLESVGQAIDDIGSSVWKGTSEIISHGKDVLLAPDLESDSSDSQHFSNQSMNSKRYSRFDAQVHAIQTDLNTYCDEPEDLVEFNNWKSGLVLDEKAEEIENLFEENGVIEGIYTKLVPNTVDHEIFWSRYFYKVHKLKQAEDARANLVKRAISGEEEEDLSWDVDDDEEVNVSELKDNSAENKGLEEKDPSEFVSDKKYDEKLPVGNSEVVVEMGEKSSSREIDEGVVSESISDNGSDEKVILEGKEEVPELKSDESVAKTDDNMFLEGKTDPSESCKDSDFSVVSSQPSLPEEEDLGWDEIEDLGSNDEKKVTLGGSPNRGDLRRRLSAAEEEEDLSWDIEDDDEPVKH